MIKKKKSELGNGEEVVLPKSIMWRWNLNAYIFNRLVANDQIATSPSWPLSSGCDPGTELRT